MLAINDYKSYKEQNISLINSLKKHNSIVYDRLSDVEKILDFIIMSFDANINIDEDLEVIFEAGFGFFHEQFELIKLYYQNYFKSNMKKFNSFETLINFSLYLDDIKEIICEKQAKDEIITNIDSLGKRIEYLIMNQIQYTEQDIESFNIELSACLANEGKILTSSEIFALISEELGL